MPRTQSTTPPLDPFPPLPRNGAVQTTSSSAQTYAAIAARRAFQGQLAVRNQQRERNAALRGDGSATLPEHTAPWSVDDIDRQDNLDELNLNGAGPSTVTVEPSPPWRRRRMDTLVAPVDETLSIADSRASMPGGSFTPQEFVVRDDEPEEEPEEDLLGNFDFHDLMAREDSGPSLVSLPTRAARAVNASSIQRMNPFTIADTGIPLWTTTSAPEGVSAARSTWDGGISAARRNGYGSDFADEVTNLSLYGTLPSSSAETLNPSQTLRRRRRILRRLADGDDPSRGGEIHAWNSMIDMPSDEDRWSRNTLYMQPNVTGEDVRLWSGSSDLHRGGNNRRRASLRERIASGESPVRLPRQWSAEEMRREISGMAPTNTASSQGSTPLVVRSRTRKVREEEKPSEDDCAQPSKRRRLNPDAPEFRPRSPPLTRPTYLSYSTLDPSIPLPDAFDPPHRTSHLALTTLRRPNCPPRPVITFTLHPMPTHTDADASALRANRAIPVSCGIHYYEAEVLDQGEAGFLSVGWMMRGADLGRLVGWDPGSWGWHADDGRSFEGQGKGESFAEKWGTGDVVGCGIDFTCGRAFFTKNGNLLGHRFSKLAYGLYPAVGLRSPRESIAVNFTGPFMFDIDQFVRDKRDFVWDQALGHEVSQVPRFINGGLRQRLPAAAHILSKDRASALAVEKKARSTSSALKEAVPVEIPNTKPDAVPDTTRADAESRTVAAWVLDYLKHHGYSSSSSLLHRELSRRNIAPPVPEAKETKRRNVPPEDLRLEDFQDRKAAIEYLEGVAASAEPMPAGLLGDLDPDALGNDESTKSLRNRILVSSFVHRLEALTSPTVDEEEADAALERVLAFGQSLRGSAKAEKWDSYSLQHLTEAFGLLGNAPGKWPMDTRITWSLRAQMNGDELGRTLRRINHLKTRSYLEQSLRQTKNIVKLIRDTGTAEAAFIDVRRIWEEPSGTTKDSDMEKGGTAEQMGGSRKRRRGSEVEVEEVVEVKEEKAEVSVALSAL